MINSLFLQTNTAMRKVVTHSDLKKALGLKGFFGTCVAGIAYGALRLGKINRYLMQLLIIKAVSLPTICWKT